VAGIPREKLEEALGQLVRSELIFRRGEISPPGAGLFSEPEIAIS
jgi:hypothetical protein